MTHDTRRTSHVDMMCLVHVVLYCAMYVCNIEIPEKGMCGYRLERQGGYCQIPGGGAAPEKGNGTTLPGAHSVG